MPNYALLDVFTERAFTGNPLAVFVGPGALDGDAMQSVAGELNLSESVFLWPPSAAGESWPTRIFTPRAELPFAGHPTIGAACALLAQGHLPDGADGATVVLDQPAGPVPVSVERVDERTARARLTSPRIPEQVPMASAADLAACIGLRATDLHPTLAPSGWSAGVPFVVIPVRDTDVLARATLDRATWDAHLSSAEANLLYLVTPLDDDAGRAIEWRVRMFAPSLGIAEDPATGGAAAAFAGFLAELDDTGSTLRTWTIHQGVEMGRPSRIDVTVQRSSGGGIRSVEVGGASVIVGGGHIEVPAR